MATIFNLIWFIVGGWSTGLAWILIGVLSALTIIGIPYAYACFRIASFSAFPSGKQLVDSRELGESRIPGTTLLNLVWIICIGWWLALMHLIVGLFFMATIVLIPVGVAYLRIAECCFSPLGKRIVER